MCYSQRDLCEMSPFARFLRQTQIVILKILNVFLRLKFLPSLNLNKIEHFSKVSKRDLCKTSLSQNLRKKLLSKSCINNLENYLINGSIDFAEEAD